MFEIPFNIIIINPVFDMFFIVIFTYFFVSKLYLNLLESEPEKISWLDLEITLIFLILAYLNYSGQKINFFGFKLDWFFSIMLVQLIVESFFAFLYWEELKIWWKKIQKRQNKKIKKKFEEEIKSLKLIQNFMENDLEVFKREKNEEMVRQLKKEIEKISKSIFDLENELEKIKKNDKKK